MVLLAAWCGLAAGELEVGARVARRLLSSTDRLYLMTRHFVWLVPSINLLLFLALGFACALAAWRWPRRGAWSGVRLLAFVAVLPTVLILGRGLYGEARLILALGLAVQLGAILERALLGRPRRLLGSGAVLLILVLVQAGWLAVGDARKRWREDARPLPPPGSPNVLLVVLDTVRADHLGAYGYGRPTTPNLEALARRGVRFDRARAAAPWTLASHATFFTGRWPHELDCRWMAPMPDDVPTLAEALGDAGYATAGFVGNTFYCGYDTGLDRGFTHYRDYPLDGPSALRTLHLVDLMVKSVHAMAPALVGMLGRGGGATRPELALRLLAVADRKDAGAVNREFLDWLSRPGRPGRPFFAFLNYVDAHAPYTLPAGVPHRFGKGPATEADFLFLAAGWQQADRSKLARPARALALDAYDSCIASMDARLGELLGELSRRRELGRTIVIVTSDHGEGLGEHGLFDHGESLYATEVHVPLLIALPSGAGPGRVIDRFVSLRDLPATILDLVGARPESSLPGSSLASLWEAPGSNPAAVDVGGPVLSELTTRNPADPNRGRSPAARGPLVSLAEGDYVYIRNRGDGAEQLFDERRDPRELTDRARNPSARAILERFRDLSGRLVDRRARDPGG